MREDIIDVMSIVRRHSPKGKKMANGIYRQCCQSWNKTAPKTWAIQRRSGECDGAGCIQATERLRSEGNREKSSRRPRRCSAERRDSEITRWFPFLFLVPVGSFLFLAAGENGIFRQSKVSSFFYFYFVPSPVDSSPCLTHAAITFLLFF